MGTPSVEIYPENASEFILGATIHFTSIVEEFENPTYQWSVDGEAVENATNPTFDFEPENAGAYLVSLTCESEGDGDETIASVIIIMHLSDECDLLEDIKAYLAKIAAAV